MANPKYSNQGNPDTPGSYTTSDNTYSSQAQNMPGGDAGRSADRPPSEAAHDATNTMAAFLTVILLLALAMGAYAWYQYLRAQPPEPGIVAGGPASPGQDQILSPTPGMVEPRVTTPPAP